MKKITVAVDHSDTALLNALASLSLHDCNADPWAGFSPKTVRVFCKRRQPGQDRSEVTFWFSEHPKGDAHLMATLNSAGDPIIVRGNTPVVFSAVLGDSPALEDDLSPPDSPTPDVYHGDLTNAIFDAGFRGCR